MNRLQDDRNAIVACGAVFRSIRNRKTTRAITPIGTNQKVQRMNTGFSRANVRVPPRRREVLSLAETIPFWFAVSSPLIGLAVGVGGAWLVSWLTS